MLQDIFEGPFGFLFEAGFVILITIGLCVGVSHFLGWV